MIMGIKEDTNGTGDSTPMAVISLYLLYGHIDSHSVSPRNFIEDHDLNRLIKYNQNKTKKE